VSDETVDWLVQEVNDLLDVSSVGLYEFIELLADSGLPAEERRHIAQGALDRLVAAGGVGLYEMRWPESEHVRPTAAVIWRRPDRDDATYVALDRESGAPANGDAAS
jgi:hypothetical protein